MQLDGFDSFAQSFESFCEGVELFLRVMGGALAAVVATVVVRQIMRGLFGRTVI